MIIQYHASSAPYHHATIATLTCCKDDIPTWRENTKDQKIVKKRIDKFPIAVSLCATPPLGWG